MLAKLIPRGFLWRLTFLNNFVVLIVTAGSGWALYSAGCFLVAEVGNLDSTKQQQFNIVFFNYLWILMIIAVFVGSVFHFYLIKRFIQPIRCLIQSTKELRLGHYPELVKVHKKDEIGQLVQ